MFHLNSRRPSEDPLHTVYGICYVCTVYKQNEFNKKVREGERRWSIKFGTLRVSPVMDMKMKMLSV